MRTYCFGLSLISQDQPLVNAATGATEWRASFYGFDGQGNVRQLFDEAGQLTDAYTYDAYGSLLGQAGANTPNRHRYAGEWFEAKVGLYFLRARLMNPATGRFWNADTFEGGRGDPQSLHRYNYTYGDPANQQDPSGNNPTLSTLMCSIGLASTLGGLTGAGFASQNPGLKLSGADGFIVGATLGAAAVLMLPAVIAAGVVTAPVYDLYCASKQIYRGNYKDAFNTLTLDLALDGLAFGAAFTRAAKLIAVAAKADVFLVKTATGTAAFIKDAKGLVALTKEGAAVQAAEATPEMVNLASSQRTTHILTGDATGGGHLFPGAPDKTPFPQDWSADQIMHEVSDVDTDPTLLWVRPDGKTSWFYNSGKAARFKVIDPATGGLPVRDGVSVKVIVEPGGEGIITAYPQ